MGSKIINWEPNAAGMRVANKEAERSSYLAAMKLRDALEDWEGVQGLIDASLIKYLKIDDPALTQLLEMSGRLMSAFFNAYDEDLATTQKHMRILNTELALLHTEIAALQAELRGSSAVVPAPDTPSGGQAENGATAS